MEELKVIILQKDSVGTVVLHRPNCDAIMHPVAGDLPAILAQIPELVKQARDQWGLNPLYPKTTMVAPPPVPAQRTPVASAAKKPDPTEQPKMF